MTTALLSKRLQSLLKHHELSESELARRIGIPRATVNRLVAGKMANPKMHMLKSLAGYFELSVDALLAQSALKPASTRHCTLPVIPWHHLPTPLHATAKKSKHYTHRDWTGAAPPRNGYLTVPAEKRLHCFPNHKQLLLVAPHGKPRPGQLVVLRMLEDGRHLIKQVFLAHQQFRFKNPNSQLHECLQAKEFTFIGLVHQVLQLD